MRYDVRESKRRKAYPIGRVS